jgi:nucleoside-diphosphate-sugar epimerase
MTQVLVTGAAGFIGSQLCESLLRRGYTVRGLDAFTEFYDPERKRQNLESLSADPRFELIVGDLRTAPLDEALDGVDLVAHLAGEPGVSNSWGQNFERYVERNVLSTQRLLEAADNHRVERLVYASSSSVYGTGGDTLRAAGEPRPASPYGVTKLAAETLVGAYAGTGLSAVSLRYFSVYGPRQRPDMAAHRFIEALLDGQPLTVYGDGLQVRDFTFVDDIVEATVQALFADVPTGAVLDVASSRPTSVNELVTHLEELVGVESTRDTNGERRGDVPRTEGDIDSARDQLGWKPTVDLRTGLKRQLDWHRSLRVPRSDAALAKVRA